MSNLQAAKRIVKILGLKDLLSLEEFLRGQVDARERKQRATPASKREVVEGSTRIAGEWTFRLEYVKCGKERCKNDRHGPYWYGYRTSGGKTVSKYFGKKLPGEKREQATPAKKAKAANGDV